MSQRADSAPTGGQWPKPSDEEGDNEELELQKAIEASLLDNEDEDMKDELGEFEFQRALLLISSQQTVPRPRLTNPLRYEPLKSSRCIRLLGILPEQGSTSRYQASLVELSLDSLPLPDYTTLSYCWGRTFSDGSHLTEVFKCEQGEHMITKNLHQALQSICRTRSLDGIVNKAFFLWADSICINQADDYERNTQVALMGEIYAKCHDMIVWLGEYSDETKTWMEEFHSATPGLSVPISSSTFLKELELYIKSLPQDQKDSAWRVLLRCPGELPNLWGLLFQGRDEAGVTPSFWQTAVSSSVDSSSQAGPSLASQLKDVQSRRSYHGLTQRPWFHRRWVIQEMAQTSGKWRTFLVGDQVKTFKEMETAARQSSVEVINTPLQTQFSNESLLQNLRRYRDTECSEPHDYIYALLGLSNDVSGLSIDYSTSTERLYSSVAEHYIQTGEHVLVLALATAQQSLEELPTWVPDWRQTRECVRSPMHADVMATISRPDRKLWRMKEGDVTDSVLVSELDTNKALGLEGWLITACSSDGSHDNLTCNKCKILNGANGLAKHGKQPIRQVMSQGGSSASLLLSRVAAAQLKWAEVIQQQFEIAMHADEVLLLLEDSAIGFVLLPAGDEPNFLGTRSYRLQFCFQVDEEGWISNWFASVLGKESKEWICIV